MSSICNPMEYFVCLHYDRLYISSQYLQLGVLKCIEKEPGLISTSE
jgi:hypothetical protein